ncbi:MAG: DOMON-like domain-containing protein, partial [Cyanobacteria bacterium J06623_7]
MSSFSLIPFDVDTAPAVTVTGTIERYQNQLDINYCLKERSQIIIHDPAAQPTRQFDLWEHTCCEFFLGLQGTSQYWEFNLSPAGHWNVFRFPDYRQNIAEEMAFAAFPFQVSTRNDVLQVRAKIDLSQIIKPSQKLEVGITAVVEAQDRQLSYWALSHPDQEPDFHLRDTFAVNL